MTRLARRRIAAGFATARQAAGMLKCSRIHLLEVEEGRSNPSLALASRIAELYGLTLKTVQDAHRVQRRELLRQQLKEYS